MAGMSSNLAEREDEHSLYRGIDLRFDDQCNPLQSWADAFHDGFQTSIPYDDYTIVKGCKCHIELENSMFHVRNRDLAVIFYRSSEPVRVFLANASTNFDEMLTDALSVSYGKTTLGAYLRNTLACIGKVQSMNAPTHASAPVPGTFYEIPSIFPFGSVNRLATILKPTTTQLNANREPITVKAEYVYWAEFRMSVYIQTPQESFFNLYQGALVSRDGEVAYPILAQNP